MKQDNGDGRSVAWVGNCFVSYKTDSFVTDEDLRGRNVLLIDSIATCSLEADHLFTLHRSISLYKNKNHKIIFLQ